MNQMKSIVVILLSCLTLSMGCVEAPIANFTGEPVMCTGVDKEPATCMNVDEVFVPSIPELDNLIQFLEEDATDEINYTGGQRGINYFVCTGFSRALAKNASEHNITMGAISLRDTPGVGVVTKYYHAMNYAIVDDSFVIIEPQSDEVFYLDTIQYHHGGAYRYVSIYQNAQMMSNYGKGRETIDIDLRDYNEDELISAWR